MYVGRQEVGQHKRAPLFNLPASAGEIPSEAIVSAKSYA